jgi:predicted Zn finger-like uncharacterized protein
MIIQCRKCETRFRFDERLVAGDGFWVRCSRCRDVFFQERSAAGEPMSPPSATEPEIPSVRIRDAKRISDNRFSLTEERLSQPNGEKAEIPPFPRGAVDKEISFGNAKESIITGIEEDMEKDALSDQVAGWEDEIDEEEFPEAEPTRRRWGRVILKILALLVFIALIAGGLYASEPAQAPVRLKDVRQRSVANLLGGNLRVVEGIAVNQSPYFQSKIRVRLVISDANDAVLGEKIVYCGNILTDAELNTLAEAEIQRELTIPHGTDVLNERIAPNGEIPFMIVFSQEQTGAIKTGVAPAGADRAP